jgi:hypothetical protein
VVLLEERKPLQLGIRLGKGKYGGISTRNSLDLGIGQFLSAYVVGPAKSAFAGHYLMINRALVSKVCHIKASKLSPSPLTLSPRTFAPTNFLFGAVPEFIGSAFGKTRILCE